MNNVPMTARTNVLTREIVRCLGIAMKTANSTKNHNVNNMVGLLFFGIPSPSPFSYTHLTLPTTPYV